MDMLSRDRRMGFRVPLEVFLNQYIQERPYRGLTTNISDTGLYVHTVRAAGDRLASTCRRSGRAASLGLELELPGIEETIWARGEVCSTHDDGHTLGLGLRFTAIPAAHARLIRDFCVESRRTHLDRLLARIRRVN